MLHRTAPRFACVVALLLLCAGGVFATSFTYDNFNAATNLNLVGNASLTTDVLRITPAAENQVGAAWYGSLVDVSRGFDTSWSFQMTQRGGYTPDWAYDGSSGGDGFAFVVQNSSPTAMGIYASGVGYYGIKNSLAVEFDTWQNIPEYCEPNNNHVAIQSLGTAENRPEHCAGSDFNGPYANPNKGISTIPFDISDGGIYTARIVYTPGIMNVYVNGVQYISSAIDLSTLLALDAGRAYIGFTSSTGGAWENHDIVSWSYTDVPEPQTMGLIGLGLLFFAIAALKR